MTSRPIIGVALVITSIATIYGYFNYDLGRSSSFPLMVAAFGVLVWAVLAIPVSVVNTWHSRKLELTRVKGELEDLQARPEFVFIVNRVGYAGNVHCKCVVVDFEIRNAGAPSVVDKWKLTLPEEANAKHASIVTSPLGTFLVCMPVESSGALLDHRNDIQIVIGAREIQKNSSYTGHAIFPFTENIDLDNKKAYISVYDFRNREHKSDEFLLPTAPPTIWDERVTISS